MLLALTEAFAAEFYEVPLEVFCIGQSGRKRQLGESGSISDRAACVCRGKAFEQEMAVLGRGRWQARDSWNLVDKEGRKITFSAVAASIARSHSK